MIGRWLVLCFVTLAGSCAMAAAKPPTEPPAGAVIAYAGFPAAGTKWVGRIVSQKGADSTATYTFSVLEEGIYQGKPVYRVSAGIDTLVYDKATGNTVADFRMGKEATAYSPHDGTLSWPLYVNKSWTASFAYHDHVNGMTVEPVKIEYRVAAYEDIVVSAGAWKAFRIESETPARNSFSTIWYAPDIKLIVKRVNETIIGHPLGQTKAVYEIIEYPAKDKTSLKSQTQTKLETGPRAEKPDVIVDAEKRKIGQASNAQGLANVVRTVPEGGNESVSTSLKEIFIVFDQPMSGSWNLNCSPAFYPDAPRGLRCTEGGTYWRDDRTFVVQITKGLKPNHRYSFGVNPSVGLENYELNRAFRGLGHTEPASPQRLFFTTGP